MIKTFTKIIPILPLSLFIILITGMLASCSKKNQFSIEGKVENIPDNVQKAYLYANDGGDIMIPIDSAVLSEEHIFKFIKNYPQPNLYQLVIGNHIFLLITQNEEKVKLYIDLSNNTCDAKGSPNSQKIQPLSLILNESFTKSQKIFAKMDSAVQIAHQKPDNVLSKHEAVLNRITEEQIQKTLTFAEQNQTSLIGLYALLTLKTIHKDFLTPFESHIASIVASLTTHLKNNPQVQQYNTSIKQEQRISIGQTAPEITLPNPQGEVQKLSDLRGKYVLIDFWASWCGPCRQENPNIVKQYNTYKNKAFTIFSVSLDNNSEAWKKAIKDDHLTWKHHVSDFKGWESDIAKQYNIESIPSSLLIDPSGKIVAKNLTAETLKEILSKVFKQ